MERLSSEDLVSYDDLHEVEYENWADHLILNEPGHRAFIRRVEKMLDRAQSRHDAAQLIHLLISLKLETVVVLAGALYFCVRDGEVDFEVVDDKSVCRLLTSMMRLKQVDTLPEENAKILESYDRDQVQNIRSMFIALIDDPRVAVLKLAERTVTLRGAKDWLESARHKIAQEVVNFYVPLANSLGIWQLKAELEDLAFLYLHEDEYREIESALLDQGDDERERQLYAICEDLRWRLQREGIDAKVSGRVKNISSIWQKTKQKNVLVEAVYDAQAVRVIVENVPECYAVLGVVHTSWPLIADEFDDYIANPKANGYSSIHTAVVGPRGRNLEVQIRTWKMHRASELGICAHWAYKDPDESLRVGKIDWMREVLHWQEDMHMNNAIDISKRDDGLQCVYVSTPQGHVIDLPKGSTAVDFAYRIHTDVGNHCCGAKINGSMKPLNIALETGQTVEILTDPEGTPQRSWLDKDLGYVLTSRARRCVQDWFRDELEEKNIAAGRNWLVEECQRMKINVEVQTLANDNNYKRVEDMYIAIAVGDQSVRALTSKYLNDNSVPAASKSSNRDSDTSQKIVRELEVEATDRPRLLLDITYKLVQMDINVVGATIESPSAGEPAILRFRIETDSLVQTREVINRLRAIPDVVNVHRSGNE